MSTHFGTDDLLVLESHLCDWGTAMKSQPCPALPCPPGALWGALWMVQACQGRRLCGCCCCKSFSSSPKGSQGCSHPPEQLLGHQEWCSGLRMAFISIHPAAGCSYPCLWVRSASADIQNASGKCPGSEKHWESSPLNICVCVKHHRVTAARGQLPSTHLTTAR